MPGAALLLLPVTLADGQLSFIPALVGRDDVVVLGSGVGHLDPDAPKRAHRPRLREEENEILRANEEAPHGFFKFPSCCHRGTPLDHRIINWTFCDSFNQRLWKTHWAGAEMIDDKSPLRTRGIEARIGMGASGRRG